MRKEFVHTRRAQYLGRPIWTPTQAKGKTRCNVRGCARHDFTLVADDPFRGRDPAQLDVILAHDGNNDRCEAYPTETYAFDLTPVRTLYRETYGTDAGAILLRFHGQDVPTDAPVAFYSLIYTLE